MYNLDVSYVSKDIPMIAIVIIVYHVSVDVCYVISIHWVLAWDVNLNIY